jgi:hypothetical protein
MVMNSPDWRFAVKVPFEILYAFFAISASLRCGYFFPRFSSVAIRTTKP